MVAAPKVDDVQPANEAEEVIVDSDTLSWSEMSIGVNERCGRIYQVICAPWHAVCPTESLWTFSLVFVMRRTIALFDEGHPLKLCLSPYETCVR